MLVLIQGFGGIYFENKILATLLCSTTTNATYKYESSPMIPHSYLGHFELVQTYCLISVLCTFRTLAIHVHGANHCPSWSIIQKLIIPLKQKEKKSKVSYHAHGSLFKKKKGKMIRARVWMTDKCRYLHMHMIKVFEWHCYLETPCLSLQNEWKRWAHTFVILQKREALPWEDHTSWAS